MSSPSATAAAEARTQEAAVVPGAGSPAGVALPKLPSWGASGWQALFKQPSAGTCLSLALALRSCKVSVSFEAFQFARCCFSGLLCTYEYQVLGCGAAAASDPAS